MANIEKINLSQLHKCDQIWTDMAPADRGRICLKCQHKIHDFRSLSDHEIAQIHAFTPGKVCGIYSKKQLQLSQSPSKKRRHSSRLIVGLLGLFAALPSNAQTTSDSLTTVQTEPDYSFKPETRVSSKTESIIKDSILISGLLQDESGEPIIYGNVFVMGTKIGTVSGTDGYYSLNIADHLDSLQTITLVFSYVGYGTETKTVDIDTLRKERHQRIDVQFQQGEIIDFYVIEKRPLPARIWHGIKSLFRKKPKA